MRSHTQLSSHLQDYQEHQNEIHQKLIAIMGDRLSAHIKALHVSVLRISGGPRTDCV